MKVATSIWVCSDNFYQQSKNGPVNEGSDLGEVGNYSTAKSMAYVGMNGTDKDKTDGFCGVLCINEIGEDSNYPSDIGSSPVSYVGVEKWDDPI